MFKQDGLPLARQVDYVFRQLEGELKNAAAGTVHIHVRNNAVGKFGMKHHPIESRNGELKKAEDGLSEQQVQSFRKMAIEALKLKRDWTHGEISYDFSVRPGTGGWAASVMYESNYNMSNHTGALFHYTAKQPNYRSQEER
ncbi:conserved hypothetical protein [Paenibacillus curdlanolyticus YK9]|uniref:O-methyltransferase n=1 Tax=Paenibacillus curdlanolyticus YK9 TaxID=717606 RepID=E0IFN6_9BACL|nr:conserved hypothetical protein [Paenibacillus curdlanolyticus YK9]